jgi:NAD(P) transhydrogenase subunit alpha
VVTWPPPPIRVPQAPPPASEAPPDQAPAPVPAGDVATTRRRRAVLAGQAAVAAGLLVAASPPDVVGHLTVLVLAIVVGLYVISHVTHALHTPLMSQTNAISGIILVGALLQIGDESPVVTTLAVVAATLASINVFGGFLVTRRMLGMFRAGGDGS